MTAREPLRPTGGEAAPNPALVLTDRGADIARALERAGFAARTAATPDAALRGHADALSDDVAQPPLVVVDLRGRLGTAVVTRVRAEGRLPVLAVADDAATAWAAVEAGANETVTSAELDSALPELANYLLRMATLW